MDVYDQEKVRLLEAAAVSVVGSFGSVARPPPLSESFPIFAEAFSPCSDGFGLPAHAILPQSAGWKSGFNG
jgi:hypothetical protein